MSMEEEEELPPIRAISFADFRRRSEFPRFPGDEAITVDIATLADRLTFNVFVSHCWIAGWSGAVEWRGRAHPDTRANDKFELCVKGIEKAWRTLCPEIAECYLWLDFGCINQDKDPAGELKQLDKIVEWSDVLFTPIVNPSHRDWTFITTTENAHMGLYKDYLAPEWQDGPYAYLNRGWCRVEMFYGSNIPLSAQHLSKVPLTKAALKVALGANRRLQLLYGTREYFNDLPPFNLPPLQNSYYDLFNPETGNLTVDTDRVKIRELIAGLLPYMKRSEAGYTGDLNDAGVPHGKGKWIFENGDSYEGDCSEGRFHGEGRYEYSGGDYSEGLWEHGSIVSGTFYYGSGDVYRGEFENFQLGGFGVFEYAGTDEVFTGVFNRGGRIYGRSVFPNGDVYEGEYDYNVRHGLGKMTRGTGEVQEGLWVRGSDAPFERMPDGEERQEMINAKEVFEERMLEMNGSVIEDETHAEKEEAQAETATKALREEQRRRHAIRETPLANDRSASGGGCCVIV